MRGRALTEEQIELFVSLVEGGTPIVACARKLAVGRSTLFNLLKTSKSIAKRIAKAREVCDEDVEGSLYRLATRVRQFVPTCPTRHKEGVGRAVCEVCGMPVEVSVPDADFRAVEFWLTNRQREKWKKRWDIENVAPLEVLVPFDVVVAFVGELADAIQRLVLDPEARRDMVDAVEAAALRFAPFERRGPSR